ncbi:hypothetical protein MVEN_00960300 [Mycena venus]|uniref:Uncharacterized protein n=1 Tax=Mycena venus TaxID=2733690 RepID=A0A8H6YDZ2_9AGAR|nr:hypothetical protein MVEN_00960300 [Mycena venus]
MDNTASAIILGAVTLMPGNRWILLGLGSATLIIYVANRQRPSHQLGQVEDAVKVAEETLECAKTNCTRNQMELMDGMRRLLKAKISASEIRAQLMDTHCITTWKEFAEYVEEMRGITQSISQCAKEVKEVHTSTLRTIEAERRRQFSEGIKECNEILDTVISSPMGRSHAARRRFVSAVTGNTPQEASIV